MLKSATFVLAAVQAAAALPSTMTAAAGNKLVDSSTGYTWQYLTGSNAATSTKVQAAYTANVRPATAAEFAALVAGAADNAGLQSALGVSGTDTGALYAGNDQWVYQAVGAAAGAPVSSDATADGGVFAVSVQGCTQDLGATVNAIDLYDFAITDNTIDGCMCNSQRSGGLCGTLTTATNCFNSTVANSEANTGQQILGEGLVDGSTESVVFNITSPQVKTRNITSFNWVNCDNLGTVQGGLSSYKTDTVASSCNDVYTYGFRVSELVSKCNLTKVIDPPGKTGFVRYRGDFMIYYKEWVNVSNTLLTRTGRLVTPIDVFINRTYSAELNTNTSIIVSSPFELQAAITSTTVKQSATTALVEITFGVKKPYEIIGIDSAGDGFGDGPGGNSPSLPWSSNNGVQDISDACILGNISTPAAACVADVNKNTDSGLNGCPNNGAYDATTGVCWNTIRILITNGDACSLDHTIRIPVISIYCAAFYNSQDCPLGPTSASADNSTGVSFTIRAADFCDGQRALVINGAITIQSYVPQRTLTRNNDAATRAYLYGETVYLLLTINQTASLKVFNLTPTTFKTKLGETGTYYAPNGAEEYITEANAGTTDAKGTKLGWDTATQTHAMRLVMDSGAVVDGTGAGLLQQNGVNPPLFAQLVFTVDYESARRRRRQAGNQLARGQAAMIADMTASGSTADVAANDNSAPATAVSSVFALATALLCGFALLL